MVLLMTLDDNTLCESTATLTDLDLINLDDIIQFAPNITSINIILNKITFLPAEIGTCINLTQLYAYSNKLKYLPDITKLIKLERLDLSYNQIKILPVIYALVELKYLFLRNNKLKFLPLLPNHYMAIAINNNEILFSFYKNIVNNYKLIYGDDI